MRYRQQRLLRRVGSEGDRIRAVVRAVAKAGHRLHELGGLIQVARGHGRTGRRIDGETAEPPIQSDLTQECGSDKGVGRNIVDFECACIDVAQHEIGRTR